MSYQSYTLGAFARDLPLAERRETIRKSLAEPIPKQRSCVRAAAQGGNHPTRAPLREPLGGTVEIFCWELLVSLSPEGQRKEARKTAGTSFLPAR